MFFAFGYANEAGVVWYNFDDGSFGKAFFSEVVRRNTHEDVCGFPGTWKSLQGPEYVPGEECDLHEPSG